MTEKRVAIVTGASRGIGEAIARRLARDGMHVALLARTADKLQQVVSAIKSEGGSSLIERMRGSEGTITRRSRRAARGR